MTLDVFGEVQDLGPEGSKIPQNIHTCIVTIPICS